LPPSLLFINELMTLIVSTINRYSNSCLASRDLLCHQDALPWFQHEFTLGIHTGNLKMNTEWSLLTTPICRS
jgi:hypothetical protein